MRYWNVRINMLLMLKLFFSKALDIAMRYPLQIILVIVSLYAINQRSQHNEIKRDFEIYKETVSQAGKFRELQNHVMKKQASEALVSATIIYDNNLKAIKNEYLKKQKLDSVTIGDLRGRLRDQIAADSFRVPEAPADTEASAEVWRNSHAAITRQYETLVSACQITTNDFNLLRDWADASCIQVGCE